MKKNLKSVALLAVLSLAAAGCQKEAIVEPNAQVLQNNSTHNVVYTIDGITYHKTIYGEQNWNDFISWLLAFAKEGHTVVFWSENSSFNAQNTKDTVIFRTQNEEEAQTWCDSMVAQGYAVMMEYDKKTGTYTCTAIK